MTIQRTVIRSALVAGAISFAAGFVIPLFLSKSSLGPLLGILITGPVGSIAGAAWGVVAAARGATTNDRNALILWIGGVWIATLAYTLFMLRLSPTLALPALGLQLLVIAATGFLLYNNGITSTLGRPIVMLCAIFIAVASAFPPPAMTFILDKRFDAARHVPLLSVHSEALLLEWTIAVAVAALATFTRSSSPDGAARSGQ